MVTIIIPTYNERGNLPRLVGKIFSLPIADKIELIIVDDSSPDGTGELAEQLKKKYHKIQVIHRKERGRGTAGIAGFKEALNHRNKYIMEMDADFSHNPEDIVKFLEEIKKYDVVIGSRYIGGRILNRSLYRNIISTLANIYNRAILGLSVRDVSSGYKCYRRNVIEALDFDHFLSEGYSIGAETLYRIKEKGFTMKEIAITFKNREYGVSKCGIEVMADYLIKIFLIRLKDLFN